MQWVKSGEVAQRLPFLAASGATSIAVRRKRGAGAWVAMTTPSVTEDDQTNCPGAWSLLMDEDMTITTGKTTEAMSFYITGAGMAPVMVQIVLYDKFPVNVTHVLGNLLQVGGAAPASPIGI